MNRIYVKIAVLSLAVLVTLIACRKNGCVTCMALSKSGIVVKHTIECDKSASFLRGFEDGLKQHYKDNGDSVTVSCLYGK